MTLTTGSSGGLGGGTSNFPIPATGFDAAGLSAAANMQILLQTNNDLMMAIHKAIVENAQETNRKIESLRDDVRDIKLNLQKNDNTLKEEATNWRSHTELLLKEQGDRHNQDNTRLMDMLMKLVISEVSTLKHSTLVPPVTAIPVPTAMLNDPHQFATAPASLATSSVATSTPDVKIPIVTTPAPVMSTQAPIVTALLPVINAPTPFGITPTPVVTTPAAVSTAPPFVATTPAPIAPASAQVVSTPTPIMSTSGSLFGGAGAKGISFADLAKKTEGSGGGLFGGGFKTPQFGSSSFGSAEQAKNFKFFQSPKNSLNASVLSSTKESDERAEDGSDKEEETPEDYTPDVHYDPVIDLPPEVEVVSGEENEEVLFVARCKLYRYDRETKENKERGLGDIKILKNVNTQKYRCVMRREKVLKLCLNFPIVTELKFHKREQMPTVYTWACKDFSEDTISGQDETYSVRFKDVNIANEFNEKMTEAIQQTKKQHEE